MIVFKNLAITGFALREIKVARERTFLNTTANVPTCQRAKCDGEGHQTPGAQFALPVVKACGSFRGGGGGTCTCIVPPAAWGGEGGARGCRTLTCRGPDGGGDGAGRQHGEALVVLGVAGLDGPEVAVAPRPEAPGQVQGIHGLRFDFPEDGLTHRLKLPIDLSLAHLQQAAVPVVRGQPGSPTTA